MIKKEYHIRVVKDTEKYYLIVEKIFTGLDKGSILALLVKIYPSKTRRDRNDES